MAVKLSEQSFCSLLQQSGLIRAERVAELLNDFHTAARQSSGSVVDSAEAFAQFLLDRTELTPWQARKLLQGKHRGFLLGKYKLLSLLGRGGMSSVYLAEHVLMRRLCAIKVLPTKHAPMVAAVDRLHLEAQAVAALDNPHIVRAYDLDQVSDGTNTIHFLVMEYVEGRSLQQIVDEEGPLPVVEAVDCLRQAASGLAHAHSAGMVHRDIKPSNLLRDTSGVVKVLDLGLARFFEQADQSSLTLEHNQRVLGTADYLSPEQAVDSHEVDSRSDLYSLGCTGYFLLTGQPPFPDGTLAQRLLAHQQQTPRPLSTLRPEVERSLEAMLDRMMAKEPENRFTSATEVVAALSLWLEQHAGQLRRPSPPRNSGANGPSSSADRVSPAANGRSTPTVPAARASRTAQPIRESSAGSDDQLERFLAGLPARDAADASPRRDVDSKRTDNGGRPQAAREHRSGARRRAAHDTVVADDALGSSHSPVDDVDFSLSPQTEADHIPDTQIPFLLVERPRPSEEQSRSGTEAREARPAMADAPPSTAARRPRRRAGARLFPEGVLAGFAIVVVVGAVLVFRGERPTPSGNSSETRTDAPRTTTGSTTDASADPRPRPPVVPAGEDITVGPGGHFATIREALEFVRTDFHPVSSSDTRTIQVAGGRTYAERIAIDNSQFGSFPQGVRIVTADANPAVLAPDGSEPVVDLQNVERFELSGFRLQSGGRPVAMRLKGYLVSTVLRRLHIAEFSQAGIVAEGMTGFANRGRVELREITLESATSDAVGLRLDAGETPTKDLALTDLRLFGPLRQGILVTTDLTQTDIRGTIFDGVEVPFAVGAEEGTRVALSRVTVSNCTFRDFQYGLQVRATADSRLVVTKCLFVEPHGPEIVVTAPEAQRDHSRLIDRGASKFNWTERPDPPTPAAEEVDIFAPSGRRGVESLRFVSTDRTSGANYLKPVGRELRAAAAASPSTPNYIGAVAP